MYDGAAKIDGKSSNQAVLAGENSLSNLLQVLRFRLGKYACVADASKCFFQVGIPKNQQDFFRIVWHESNDLKKGKPQMFRCTRHVYRIDLCPYVTLLALKKLIVENPANASQVTLSAIEHSRYMNDLLLLSNDSLVDLKMITSESMVLFEGRGFSLHKWAANLFTKQILLQISRCDLATCVREVDLGSDPLPNYSALGLTWDTESDVLLVRCCNFVDTSTWREISSQLASQFDPLGVGSPFLLGVKLILQKTSSLDILWDEKLPVGISERWKKLLSSLYSLCEFDVARNWFGNVNILMKNVLYQLREFFDASNLAFGCVKYLRGLANGLSETGFLVGKSRLISNCQSGWVISRKKFPAAKCVVR